MYLHSHSVAGRNGQFHNWHLVTRELPLF
uniref:Uncharacterized protein n=1 Tax=Medicago truncatula TaxID=3880 RepID=I3T1D6_MEDTR|nr:unknown [Medicago truncatula]